MRDKVMGCVKAFGVVQTRDYLYGGIIKREKPNLLAAWMVAEQ